MSHKIAHLLALLGVITFSVLIALLVDNHGDLHNCLVSLVEAGWLKSVFHVGGKVLLALALDLLVALDAAAAIYLVVGIWRGIRRN